MTKYVNSSEAVTSNLLLWSPLHTQTSIIDTHVVEVYPQTSIDYSDTVSFLIKASPKHMIQNIEIISEIRVLTAGGGNPALNTNVSVVSNLANAIWRSVDVVIGGQNILQSFDNSYNIGSWFDIALNTPDARAPYLLQKELFLMDDATTKAHSESSIIHPVGNVVNKSVHTRGKMVAQGKTVTLISDLNCSLFKTGKLLPTNLDVRVSLTKNYDGYVLLEAGEGTHKVKFDKCYLRVTLQQPSDICLNLMEQKLLKTPAVYQAEEGRVSFHSIPAGNELVTINNLFPQGNLPVMFTFGVQDRTAFGNSRTKNPYTFHPMKKVQVYVEGKPYFPSVINGKT